MVVTLRHWSIKKGSLAAWVKLFLGAGRSPSALAPSRSRLLPRGVVVGVVVVAVVVVPAVVWFLFAFGVEKLGGSLVEMKPLIVGLKGLFPISGKGAYGKLGSLSRLFKLGIKVFSPKHLLIGRICRKKSLTKGIIK